MKRNYNFRDFLILFVCLVGSSVIVKYSKLQPGPWLKEVELKTATSEHAEMDDDLSFEICNSNGNCCFFKVANFPYNQYEKGLVENFKYGQLKRCRNFEIGDLKSMRVDHYGEDGWQGEYVKLFTDSGPDYYCPVHKFWIIQITKIWHANDLNIDRRRFKSYSRYDF